MENRHHIGHLKDIPRLGSRVISTEQGEIAVFRTTDDNVFAVSNRCPHKNGPLSEGIVHGHTVTCPLHNLRLNLENGQAIAPDEGCVERFTVHVDASGELFLEM
ncbi:MAG: nitrite reductase (NAD(P)H) small subunit [Candidatus Parabeggiatoa sp. nov. 3]|nr:MAG: nitrite reductase (NAD(P)H) small subunit [Gammaproteobacteria bacterium]RKZ63788.1 MAG: nitrite reductase (NAD(P)H) small subunit [Gammaproteobacteria bacterium]RKZ82886.1 MAG: nitrite reductase (NAD(P)H) small subunit [Gammaproteobacteria bacterium]